METKTKIKGTVLTLAVSVMISMILQTIRHKLQVCGLSAYNVEDTFATAYIIGISYASVIYAHFCYKNMKEPSDFFRWFKDNAFIHIQTAVVLCFSVLKYTRYVFFQDNSHSHRVLAFSAFLFRRVLSDGKIIPGRQGRTDGRACTLYHGTDTDWFLQRGENQFYLRLLVFIWRIRGVLPL